MSAAFAKSGVVAATDLLTELELARGRLDASVALLQLALDLRELLWCGIRPR